MDILRVEDMASERDRPHQQPLSYKQQKDLATLPCNTCERRRDCKAECPDFKKYVDRY